MSDITIVVIDDEPSIVSLLEDMFHERGWDVVAIEDIEDGREIVKTQRPDVIILDLWFGGANGGWPLLHGLMNDPLLCSIPIIVVSEKSDDLKSRDAWFTEHGIVVIRKPFDIDGLYAAVDLALACSETVDHISAATG